MSTNTRIPAGATSDTIKLTWLYWLVGALVSFGLAVVGYVELWSEGLAIPVFGAIGAGIIIGLICAYRYNKSR